MGTALRFWWQKIKQHSFITTGILIVLIALIAFVLAAYRFGWSGTGFLNKTLWDWLQLLIIPLALAVVALLFNRATTRTEQKIALDKQRQDLLEAYLDRMAELLLEKQLGTSASKEMLNTARSRYKYGRGLPRGTSTSKEVRNVARVRTISVLTQLDTRRIGFVFAFLREANLMSTTSNESVVSFDQADLQSVDWSQADLHGTDLRGANLSGADLSGADLSGANLSRTILSGADLNFADLYQANLCETDLSGANLSKANLSKTNLTKALLSGANLSGANLLYAHLCDADLSKSNLNGSDLHSADLRGANLEEAHLSGTDLSEANLSGAFPWSGVFDISGTGYHWPEELKTAKSLKGTTMPDGSILIRPGKKPPGRGPRKEGPEGSRPHRS